jgi:hypothetical protein
MVLGMPSGLCSHVMLLEFAIVALSIVCFVVLDLYVLGCERI